MVNANLFRFPSHETQTNRYKSSIQYLLVGARLSQNLPTMWQGAASHRLVKPQASCSACKEDFSHICADDGPAWLTLLIIGHAVVPLMLFFGRSDVVPLWLAILMLAVATLIGVYFILPRAKGIFIALIWLTGATGQNGFYDSPDLKD